MSSKGKIVVVDDVGEPARVAALFHLLSEQGYEVVEVKADVAPQISEALVRASMVQFPTPIARRRRRAHFRREGMANMMGRLSRPSASK